MRNSTIWAATGLLVNLAGGCGGEPAVGGTNGPSAEDTTLVASALRINEVVSSNHGAFEDEFGESPDFIELYNSGAEPIELGGYSLSDDAGSPQRWVFGDVSLAAGQYLVVAASERDVRSFEHSLPTERHGLSTYIWQWNDGQSTPPGGSYVLPDRFANGIYGLLDGRTVISAKVYVADNSKSLGWSAAIIHHGWAGWDASLSLDLSAYNRAYLEATLPENTAYELRLCMANENCSEGYVHQIVGTGVANDRYSIPIAGKVQNLDLSRSSGFELRPVTTGVEASILVTDFVFSHGGYHLHTNFALAKAGETLVLSNADGKAIDRRKIPTLKTDVSYGRSAASEDEWMVFSQPTPGAVNAGPEYQGVCPAPTLSVASGMYSTVQSLSAPSSPHCQVHLTLDGTLPTRDSPLLDSAMPIERTVVVRATAAGPDWLESEITTESYFMDDRHELPVVSIATEPSLLFDPTTGIYELGPAASSVSPYTGANFWKDIEIPAYLQFFEPDGRLGFESGVGISIFGNYSRANPEKSLEVDFRARYGTSRLDYLLFPDHPNFETFDAFILRNSGNDFGKTMFRDALGSSLCDTMALDYQAYRPAVVYINGQYWGIHNIREKLNAGYLATHHGLAEGTFDLLRPGESAQTGTNTAWKALTQQLETDGAASDAAYAAVASQVDIDNFIDFNCAEIYDGNTDWPGNNVKWWKEHATTGRWRWMLYDMDLGFGDPAVDVLTRATTVNSSWPNPEWSTLLLRKLLENSSFRARFIARCALRLETSFSTDRVLGRIDTLAKGIESEIPRFFTRWKLDPAKWTVQVEGLRTFARARPDAVRKHFAAHFGLSGTVRLTIEPGSGGLDIDGIPFSGAAVTLRVFAGSPLTLTAVAPLGRTFRGYSDGVVEAARTLVVTEDTTMSLSFE